MTTEVNRSAIEPMAELESRRYLSNIGLLKSWANATLYQWLDIYYRAILICLLRLLS